MKYLVKIQQPHNYIYRGKTTYVNPNDVTRLFTNDEGHTVIVLRDCGEIVSEDPREKVASEIQQAL